MRRHESLIPLSHFHRSCLFLALMAKPNAPNIKGYPTKLQAKIEYAISFYQQELSPHFTVEANLWVAVNRKSKKLKMLIEELTTEREELIQLFTALSEKPSEELLNAVGILLEKHVRKE